MPLTDQAAAVGAQRGQLQRAHVCERQSLPQVRVIDARHVELDLALAVEAAGRVGLVEGDHELQLGRVVARLDRFAPRRLALQADRRVHHHLVAVLEFLEHVIWVDVPIGRVVLRHVVEVADQAVPLRLRDLDLVRRDLDPRRRCRRIRRRRGPACSAATMPGRRRSRPRARRGSGRRNPLSPPPPRSTRLPQPPSLHLPIQTGTARIAVVPIHDRAGSVTKARAAVTARLGLAITRLPDRLTVGLVHQNAKSAHGPIGAATGERNRNDFNPASALRNRC